MKTLKKIPVVGWLVCAVALLVFLLILALKKVWLMQARLRVEASLRRASDQKSRAILEIVKGQRERGIARQKEAAKREFFFKQKRSNIAVKSMQAGGISDAVDKAFSRHR